MNIDKRYCQNRVRKRKKNMENFLLENQENSAEEERLFKLSRFVKDVDKFVKENELPLVKKSVPEERVPVKTKKIDKKIKPSRQLVKRGMFQNGVQTRFYRRGVFGKEMTARLDENLQQIISLASNNSKCQSSRHCKHTTHTSSQREPLQQLYQRTSPNPSNWQNSPNPQSIDTEAITEIHKPSKPLDDLDSKLYPEFTRIITIVCTESKSIHFRKKSYVTSVKKKLLDIYLKGKKENTQESSCPSENRKSSVATSPLGNHSPLTEQQPGSTSPHTEGTCDSEPTFHEINFVPKPLKSNMQFLEETIGPGSSCKNLKLSPELQERYRPTQLTSPITRHPTHCHKDVLPRGSECSNAPLLFHPPSGSPTYNFTPIVFNGGGDRLHFNKLNCFLPPLEEESPEFRYFPRRMF